MNCAMKTKFPLWDLVWNFVSRPLVIISGIIILVETLPRPYSEWLLWNPLVHITGRVREAFYVDYVGSYADLRYPLEIAGIPKKQANDRVLELLRLVGLEQKANAYPSHCLPHAYISR